MKYSKALFGFFLIVGFNLLLFRSEIIEQLDYKIYDFSSNIIASEENSKSSVVVVDIDEKSLDYMGQWPWSRVILAKLIHNINSANPSSIGLDIIFPETDKTSPNNMIEFYKKYFGTNVSVKGLPKNLLDSDEVFTRVLSNSKTTLAVYLSNTIKKHSQCILPKQNIQVNDSSNIGYEAKNILCNIQKIQKNSANIGFINSSQDSDGVFRRLPLFMKYKDNIVPTLGLASLMSIDKVTIDKKSVSILDHVIQTGENKEVLLKFYDKSWYKTVSAVDLLLGKVDKKILQGKFVFVGTSAVGLHDRYIVSSGDNLSGVKIHATLVDNILNDVLRYELPTMKKVNILLSILFSIILLFYMYIKNQIKIIVVFISVITSFFALSLVMLSQNVYISSAYFLIPFGIVFFTINIILVVINYTEKQIFYKELTKAHSSAIDSMALVVESRDTETGAHIKRTKEYVNCLSEYLYENKIYKDVVTREFISLVYRASPLHDIGKVAIPDNILKKPGKLTEEEFEIMKEHPKIGKEVLENALGEHEDNEFLKTALRISYYHHEKWNGEGYPNGLKGEEIPLEARMMALADVYDALISKRVYKDSISYEKSEQIIIDARGTHFDPVLVDAFIVLKDKFKEIATKIT